MESNLVNLRAELHRKRSDIKKFGVNKKANKLAIKSDVLSRNNAGVSARAIKDEEQHEKETKTLKNSKSILEQKAALYEKLHGGLDVLDDETLNDKYLVNFQKKIIDNVMEKKKEQDYVGKGKCSEDDNESSSNSIYPAQSPDDEWVEYTDTLGRSRMCQKKDLTNMKEQDRYLAGDDRSTEQNSEPMSLEEESFNIEMKYREQQRVKWETEEEQSSLKKDIHYSDVLFDEARTHGVGFMKFSKEEKKRKEQQEFLKELAQEKDAAIAQKAITDAKKKKLMEARLAKVRARKRLKLGLPMKSEDLESPNESEDEIGPPLPPSIVEELPKIELTDKEIKVREWDVGKEEIMKEMSQEQWVDKNRLQRNQEFAPPTLYANNNSGRANTKSKKSKSLNNTEMERNNTFAPPPTFDYYGPSLSRRKSDYDPTKLENTIKKGLSALRQNNC